jgi:hypothetical protein
LAFGFWLLAFGFWLLAFGFWLLAFGFWLLNVRCGAAKKWSGKADQEAKLV